MYQYNLISSSDQNYFFIFLFNLPICKLKRFHYGIKEYLILLLFNILQYTFRLFLMVVK